MELKWLTTLLMLNWFTYPLQLRLLLYHNWPSAKVKSCCSIDAHYLIIILSLIQTNSLIKQTYFFVVVNATWSSWLLLQNHRLTLCHFFCLKSVDLIYFHGLPPPNKARNSSLFGRGRPILRLSFKLCILGSDPLLLSISSLQKRRKR